MASKTVPVFISFLFFFLVQIHFSAGENLVKAAYWANDTYFPVADIDSTLFTHLLCAFADLDPQTNKLTVYSSNTARFSSFTQTVQRKNPSVKTLLSTGAANPAVFASMASQPSTRKSFIDSSINLARSYNFHGLDLNWEFPSSSTEMTNFGTLLTEWRAAVATESKTSGKPPLLLTAAVYYSSTYRSFAHPVNSMANSLDWINVMAYDLYAPGWSPNVIQPPAGLYHPASQVSGDSGIRAWIQAGMAAEKIVLGLPFYGYAWNLVDPYNHGLFAPANGAAIAITGGALGYKQIRVLIARNNISQTVYNSTVVTDYCYFRSYWIGYDDVNSVSAKVLYAKAKGLLGYFAWNVALDYDWLLSRTATQA